MKTKYIRGSYHLIWLVIRHLRANRDRTFFPQTVTDDMEKLYGYRCSWLEVDLALRMGVEYGQLFRRDDGRYLWQEKKA